MPAHRRQCIQWVARNRARSDPTRSAGALVAEVTRTLKTCDLRRMQPVVDALSDAVDDEFERHCRAVDVRNGQLVIHVDGPSLVSEMQRRWQVKLCGVLRQSPRRLGVRDVRFEHGCLGLPIPSAQRRRAVELAAKAQADPATEECQSPDE